MEINVNAGNFKNVNFTTLKLKIQSEGGVQSWLLSRYKQLKIEIIVIEKTLPPIMAGLKIANK